MSSSKKARTTDTPDAIKSAEHPRLISAASGGLYASGETTASTVQIEKLVYGGDGLARIDGQVVLVPYTLPAEELRITTRRVKNGLLRGTPGELLQPSPARVKPGCEYFGECGGCHYQHADYAHQLECKTEILRETLARTGGVHFEGEIRTVSAEPWGYRNRIQLHFANGKAGFHRAGSHDVYGISHCPISSPFLNEAIAQFSTAVRQPQWPKFLRSLDLFTNESELQLTIADSTRPVAARFFEWCGTFLPPLAPAAIEYAAAGHVFRISRGTFFQVNRFLVDKLVEEVTRDVEGSKALDLYAGAGLFSVPLAEKCGELTAVERGGPAFRDLEWNTQNHGNIRSAKGSAEEFLSQLEQRPDVVVADPPRAGMDKHATAELLRLKPEWLVVVSCDPATLARDCKALQAAYRLERVTLVDLFPQTYHFETVAKLRIAA